MSELRFDDTVDITDVVCPVTFVKAKVAIEELDDGQILAVRMNDGEPVQKVMPFEGESTASMIAFKPASSPASR